MTGKGTLHIAVSYRDSGVEITRTYAVREEVSRDLDRYVKRPDGKDLAKPIEQLVKLHEIWADSNGQTGQQLDISKFDLRGCTNFQRARLTMMKGVGATLHGVNFSESQLQAADLSTADLRHANFQSADMRGGKFSGAKFSNCSLKNAQLQPLSVAPGKVIATDMSQASLRFANLSGANLQQVNFRDADLSDANLTDADMTGADLTGANMTGARTGSPRKERT